MKIRGGNTPSFYFANINLFAFFNARILTATNQKYISISTRAGQTRKGKTHKPPRIKMSNEIIKATATKEVEIKSGLVARVEYTGTYYPERDIDGGWGGTQSESYSEEIKVVIVHNGNEVGSADLDRFVDASSPIVKTCPDYDFAPKTATMIAILYAKDNTRLGISVSDALISLAEFRAICTELAASARPEQIVRIQNAATAREQKDEQAAAQRILDCTRVFETSAERKAWRKQYNDAVNEGGEGHIPMSVTRADVAWAKKVLGLNAENND